MMNQRIDPCSLACPSQSDLDAFRRAGVDIMALATPMAMKVAAGAVAQDGLFKPDPVGERWFAFEEQVAGDVIFWSTSSRRVCTWSSRAFALGQDMIENPATYSFDCNLNIFADPLEWLRARRDGIVVLPDKWPLAFERLRTAPRIALAEQLLPLYRRYMKPERMPELMIIPGRRRAA